jgi:predicted dehydrogenase
MMPLRAAIVGLGQVGMRFDEDPRRTGVWTHFTAYEKLAERFDLTAVCDPDQTRLEVAVKRRPQVKAYSDIAQLLAKESVDVVSLCTPPEFHASQILQCSGKVKAIICEKPLADAAAPAREAVEVCRSKGTLLAVNYYKRFDGVIPAAKQWITRGGLGRLKLVNAIFCGPLDAVGSHMVDLLRFLFGELEICGCAEVGMDRWSLTMRAANEALVCMHNVGPREEFVFEVDALGDLGRVRITNNGSDIEFFRYRESERYSGYRELFLEQESPGAMAERFVPLFLEVADVLDGTRDAVTSDGGDALRTQQMLEEIAQILKQR